MRKILLLSLGLIAASSAMSAKTLTYYFNDAPVAAGSTIYYDKWETFPAGKDLIEVYIEPKIYLESDVTDKVSVRTTSTYPVQLCIGGDCSQDYVITKENIDFTAGTREDLYIDSSIMLPADQQIVLPEIEVTIDAWYSSNPSEVTTIYLNMGSAGVENVIVDSDVVPVYYNLQGVRVESPSNGVFIRVQGNKVSKEILK